MIELPPRLPPLTELHLIFSPAQWAWLVANQEWQNAVLEAIHAAVVRAEKTEA